LQHDQGTPLRVSAALPPATNATHLSCLVQVVAELVHHSCSHLVEQHYTRVPVHVEQQLGEAD
jgi:hypothetical protein